MIRGSIIIKDTSSYNGRKIGASLIAPEHNETRINTGVGTGKQIELKQIFSSSRSTSTGIGYGPKRSMVFSHPSGDCQGMNCSCSKIALHFLQHSDDDNVTLEQHKHDEPIKELGSLASFINRHIPFLKENVSVPYMFIVNQGNTVFCLSSYNEEDFVCEPINHGCYQIRDAFVWLDSECEVGTELTEAVEAVDRKSDTMNHIITPTLETMCDLVNVSLKEKLTYFPLPSSTGATGVTLLQNGCKSMLRITRHEFSSSAKAAHPRRAVNSYNFFAMEYRKLVRTQQQEDQSEATMTNNQWNKLAGARWRALSEEQQAPYHRMAEADKRRYNQECIAAGIEAANRKPRPTAYNLFVHQEKQFVKGTSVENVKECTGKHCSLRWQRMSEEEQRIYQLLADSL